MYYVLYSYNKVNQKKENVKKIVREIKHIYSIYWKKFHVYVDSCSSDLCCSRLHHTSKLHPSHDTCPDLTGHCFFLVLYKTLVCLQVTVPWTRGNTAAALRSQGAVRSRGRTLQLRERMRQTGWQTGDDLRFPT